MKTLNHLIIVSQRSCRAISTRERTWPFYRCLVGFQLARPSSGPSRSFASISKPSINPNEDVYDLVIIGGGIAGSALACALASSTTFTNKRIALVEASPLPSSLNDPEKRSSGNETREAEFKQRVVSLTPASADFFKDIGAWSHLERAKAYRRMMVWDSMSSTATTPNAVTFDAQSIGKEVMAYIVENDILHSAILRRILEVKNSRSSKMIELCHGSRVKSITPDNPQVEPTHEAATIKPSVQDNWPVVELESGKKLKTRLLVGADGINSPVRSFASIESVGWDYNQMGVVGVLKLDSSSLNHDRFNETAYQRFLPSGPLALLPLSSSHSSFVWTLPTPLAQKMKTVSPVDIPHMINIALHYPSVELDYVFNQISKGNELDFEQEFTWRSDVYGMGDNDAVSSIPKVQSLESPIGMFPLRLRHATRYVVQRVALVGDAAHTIHPLAGQGLNLGIADVKSLVEVLNNAAQNGQDIGSYISLLPYSTARYTSNMAMLSAIDKIQKLFCNDNQLLRWIRAGGLSITELIGSTSRIGNMGKKMIMQFAMGYGIDPAVMGFRNHNRM